MTTEETREQKVARLTDEVGVLSQMSDPQSQEQAEEKKKQLAELEKGSDKLMADDKVMEIPVSEEEFLAGGSKFAQAGDHPSEAGVPYWKTAGKSIAFPFTITEGIDKSKEGEIIGGISPQAVWKVRETLDALGVPYQIVNGKVQFNIMDCPGKPFLSVWTTQVDTRTPEEGGKGGSYTKPTKALPIGATVKETS